MQLVPGRIRNLLGAYFPVVGVAALLLGVAECVLIPSVLRQELAFEFRLAWQAWVFTTLLLTCAIVLLGNLLGSYRFSGALTSFVFLSFAQGAAIKLRYLSAPLTFTDLRMLNGLNGGGISYLTRFDWGSSVVQLFVGLALSAILARSCAGPAGRLRSRLYVAGFSAALAVAVGLILAIMQSKGVWVTRLYSMSERARVRGFTLLMLSQFRKHGYAAPPREYSETNIQKILDRYGAPQSEGAASRPDVIAVMLESFTDPFTWSKGIQKDPIPFFRSLQHKFQGGDLAVPTFGANTANTEFEFLTGFPLAVLTGSRPIREVPYMTVMSFPMSSLARILSGVGYRTLAVHGNIPEFFNRSEAYHHLGFDQFIDIQGFPNIARFRDLPSDEVTLQRVAEEASQPGQQFIFWVTYASHGPFRAVETEESEPQFVQSFDSENARVLEAYARAIHHVDRALEKLVRALERRGKPTILVAFGDHPPSLNPELNALNTRKFTTTYAVWSNSYKFPELPLLSSYSLSSELLSWVGVPGPAQFQLNRLISRATPRSQTLQWIRAPGSGTGEPGPWEQEILSDPGFALVQSLRLLAFDELLGSHYAQKLQMRSLASSGQRDSQRE